jgi:hypothetical protein
MVTPVNNIVLKDNVVESAQNNLLYQFKDLPNINTMVKIFAAELQEIENESNNLLLFRTLEDASGKQLDNIGEVLGLARQSTNDEIYRSFLKIRNVRQTGVGSAESVTSLLKLFTGDENISFYKGEKYQVDVTYDTTCNPASESLSVIGAFFPVVTTIRATISSGTPFGFLGDTTALGFGSIHDSAAGGAFVSNLQVV